jgi:hypothetical protein
VRVLGRCECECEWGSATDPGVGSGQKIGRMLDESLSVSLILVFVT